jgi:hypothetical protein
MRARLTLLLIVTPAIVWVLFGLLGDRVSSSLSSRFGPQILARGDGKFTSVQPFVKRRLKDAAVLMTAACLLIVLHRRLAAFAIRRLQTPARWIVQGWSAFICLNVFAGVAAHTALFWCLLYTGKDHTINYTQYNIKRALLEEAGAPCQAVLMGASQTRAQIDTKALNERLGRRVWTTELHFPGSSPYDMTLCLERLPKVPLAYVITYVSETTFYSRTDNERLMYFFGFRDLPAYCALGPGKPEFDRFEVCGLMGDIFPLYRVWDSLAARVRGFEAQTQAQQQYDASLETNLEYLAQSSAEHLGFGPVSSFHKRSFTAFAKMCRERGCRLIVCCGQLNPIAERALNPALRPDMAAFLHEQAARDTNMILLEPSQLPPQVEADYEDLTHVNPGARARFSQYIAEVLDKLVPAKSP